MSLSRASAAYVILFIACVVADGFHSTAHAFVLPSPWSTKRYIARDPISPAMATRSINPIDRPWSTLKMSTLLSDMDMDLKSEISSMKTKDIRKELESYGLSTTSYFEKRELVDALAKARREEKIPIEYEVDETTAPSSTTFDTSSTSRSSASTPDRKERIKREMEKCLKLKVRELKEELESYGESIKSFIEKSDIARAVAKARIDGPTKSTASGSNSGRVEEEEEPWDPSYKDVFVTKFVADQDLLLDVGIIDVRAR
mmetsp:Transcript_17585/g.42307  ORF Transcript_17585/g.42307 Transcript_17585/m.42307 type:complete len:258 (-) Transcript_17585:381-1154(-)|eukprot:CAMPEP_0181106350 /NCGR_PEP_ID=MMETSP1071-20121207/16485_1 /TAXON_ID=35127 /ORGANISM="Thalassiosira sp., Strain NH16" /LENGTH=257 /DNA_ID=CAMNT_0023189751 /DNA_START=181 /DNA_END=954 /DNA_ORIENTATION=+